MQANSMNKPVSRGQVPFVIRSKKTRDGHRRTPSVQGSKGISHVLQCGFRISQGELNYSTSLRGLSLEEGNQIVELSSDREHLCPSEQVATTDFKKPCKFYEVLNPKDLFYSRCQCRGNSLGGGGAMTHMQWGGM